MAKPVSHSFDFKSIWENLITAQRDQIEVLKKTITVPELRKLLGVSKTESYWILKHTGLPSETVNGEIRISIDTFEKWYANQLHYHKSDGSKPGKEIASNSYSVAEISAMIGVSVTTVNVWLRGGVMPYYVVGQQRRIKKSDFRAWLKAQSKYHVTKN